MWHPWLILYTYISVSAFIFYNFKFIYFFKSNKSNVKQVMFYPFSSHHRYFSILMQYKKKAITSFISMLIFFSLSFIPLTCFFLLLFSFSLKNHISFQTGLYHYYIRCEMAFIFHDTKKDEKKHKHQTKKNKTLK